MKNRYYHHSNGAIPSQYLNLALYILIHCIVCTISQRAALFTNNNHEQLIHPYSTHTRATHALCDEQLTSQPVVRRAARLANSSPARAARPWNHSHPRVARRGSSSSAGPSCRAPAASPGRAPAVSLPTHRGGGAGGSWKGAGRTEGRQEEMRAG